MGLVSTIECQWGSYRKKGVWTNPREAISSRVFHSRMSLGAPALAQVLATKEFKSSVASLTSSKLRGGNCEILGTCSTLAGGTLAKAVPEK